MGRSGYWPKVWIYGERDRARAHGDIGAGNDDGDGDGGVAYKNLLGA